MSDLIQQPPPAGERGRAERRRTLRRRLLLVAAPLLILAVLVPWLALRGPARAGALSQDPPQLAVVGRGAAVSPSPAGTLAPLPRPTKSRPLKIYFGGDSLAGYPCLEFGKLAAASGVMRLKADYVVSSRLCYNVPINWPARLNAQLRLYHPAAVVFMIGANDGGAAITVDGKVYGFWTDAWFTAFRKRVGGMMDAMLHNGVKRIYWVGMPIMKAGDYPSSDQMRRLNAAYRAEAKLRPAARYIDIWRLLATSAGQWDPRWRASWDPAHLNPAGARRVAVKVMTAIKNDWLPPQ